MSKSLVERARAHPPQFPGGEVFSLFDETLLVGLELSDVLIDLVSLRSDRKGARCLAGF
jgi:hypothetical protein